MSTKYTKMILRLLMLGVLVGPVMAKEELSLVELLETIREKHPAVAQFKYIQAAAEKKRVQGDTVVQTRVYGAANLLSEKKPSNFSSFLGQETGVYGLQGGLFGILDTGTQWKTGLELTSTSLPGANRAQLANPDYSESRLFVQLTQALWRDAGNKALVRTKKQTDMASDSEYAAASFAIQQLLVEAELAYWRRAILAQLNKQAEEARARAATLANWMQTRRDNALAQESDVAQAQALLNLRELQLEQAKSDLEQAIRALRYWSAVPVSLEVPTDKELFAIVLSKPVPIRADLQAQLASVVVASLNIELAQEALKPAVSLSGTLALHQRSNDIGNVMLSTLSTQYPSLGMVVQLELPLDTASQETLVESYREGLLAQQKKAQALTSQIQIAWQSVRASVSDAQRRLKKAQALEASQYQKWQLESVKHKKGRTTLSQVLTFEQDYADAQALVLRAKLDVLSASTQAKLFGTPE